MLLLYWTVAEIMELRLIFDVIKNASVAWVSWAPRIDGQQIRGGFVGGTEPSRAVLMCLDRCHFEEYECQHGKDCRLDQADEDLEAVKRHWGNEWHE